MSAASKTVLLITGANRGIGHAFVKALVATTAGPFHVFLCARDQRKAAAAIEALGPLAHGHSVSPVQLDVTDRQSISAAAAQVQAEAGRVDILISNAGVVSQDADPAVRLQESFATNVFGPFNLINQFERLLTTTRPGVAKRLVHLTSDLGSVTGRLDPQNKLYNATRFEEYRISKSAVNMMVANQAFAFKGVPVKVFAFNPGLTATDLTGSAEAVKAKGARPPEAVAEALIRVVSGERDDDRASMVDVNGVLPW